VNVGIGYRYIEKSLLLKTPTLCGALLKLWLLALSLVKKFIKNEKEKERERERERERVKETKQERNDREKQL